MTKTNKKDNKDKENNLKIVWQKHENLFEKIEEKLYSQANLEDDDFDEDFDEEDDDTGFGPEPPENPSAKQPFLFTGDGGAIPMNEYFPSSKIYNFWIGYTNFPITDEIMDVIDFTDGVETLERFSRYRMRVAVAKLFKPSEVLSSIGKNVKSFVTSSKPNKENHD